MEIDAYFGGDSKSETKAADRKDQCHGVRQRRFDNGRQTGLVATAALNANVSRSGRGNWQRSA